MLIDMHVHTDLYSPCSILRPKELIRRAEELRLSGIVFTEHDYSWPQENIDALKKETGTELLLLRGQEVSSSIGHVLVFGCHENLEHLSIEEISDRVHRSGGIVLRSHPFRYGNIDLSLNEYEEMFNVFDGIEVLNGNQTPDENRFGLNVWESLGIPGIGGSDSHSVEMVGKYVTEFKNKIKNEHDLIQQIKEGRCKPYLHSRFNIDRLRNGAGDRT